MKDKVVVVTGGSSGIGKALAGVFGENGAKVVITGRDETRLQAAAAELQQKGIDCLPVCCDVADEAQVKNMADTCVAAYGKIDILINNAGISMRALFETLDLQVMHKLMDTNFFGAVNATKHCLPHIIRQKGSVVGVSSIAGYRGLPGRAGYSASKFALQGFLEVLRTEMLYKGVHVLIACPGFVSTEIRKHALTYDGSEQAETPRDEQKMMSAETCAKHIYRATLKRRSHLVLTFQGKLTVLLNKFFPRFMDKMVYKAMAKEPGSPFK